MDLYYPPFLLKQKSAPTEVNAPKNATPIVAKQILNVKGKPYYNPGGITFLPYSNRTVKAKGHKTPIKNIKVTLRVIQICLAYVLYHLFKKKSISS